MIYPGSSIMQMAWVVNDINEAVSRYSRVCNIGPFFLSRHLRIDNPKFRGRSTQTDFSSAIAQAGHVQVELIEQHDDSQSIYRDIVPLGKEGFHHVAVLVPNVSAEVLKYKGKGFEVAFEGSFAGSPFAYVDTSPALGHMTEILTDDDVIGRFFGAIRRAAEVWDGQNPLRDLSVYNKP